MKKMVLLLLVIVFSCAKETVEKPEKLLSEAEMSNILYDLAMLQAVRTSQPQVLDSNRVDAKTYVYKKYNIDSLTFASNNTWYASNLEMYDNIQKNVSERIKKEKEAFRAKKDTVKGPAKPSAQLQNTMHAKRDSLRQAALDRLKHHKNKN